MGSPRCGQTPPPSPHGHPRCPSSICRVSCKEYWSATVEARASSCRGVLIHMCICKCHKMNRERCIRHPAVAAHGTTSACTVHAPLPMRAPAQGLKLALDLLLLLLLLLILIKCQALLHSTAIARRHAMSAHVNTTWAVLLTTQACRVNCMHLIQCCAKRARCAAACCHSCTGKGQ